MVTPSLAHVIETEALLEEPVLIEVDTRVIVNLVLLAATAIQIATGSPHSRETPSDGITPQATTNWAHAASTGSQQKEAANG